MTRWVGFGLLYNSQPTSLPKRKESLNCRDNLVTEVNEYSTNRNRKFRLVELDFDFRPHVVGPLGNRDETEGTIHN